MSVSWVQDANSNYEISSVNHLLQLMHEGGLFTDTGAAPASYLTSNYIQTTDIDLASHHANIVPIGSVSGGSFTGVYDGQDYRLSNWSFDATGLGFGLGIGFICVLSGASAVIKNLILDGVWVFIDGGDAGFLAGIVQNESVVFNITTNFASGTRLVGGDPGSVGVIAGWATSSMHNITVGGTIDECSGNRALGGIVGAGSGTGWSHLRNIATFTTPIQGGNNIGGIAGTFDAYASHFMNAMTGDITTGGGIFGRLRNSCQDIVCSMRGNITGTGSAGIARSASGLTFTRVLNYMTGNVDYGLFGNVGTSTIEKSVVALNGTTRFAAVVSNNGTSEILLDTSFGIVPQFTNDTITTMDLSSFDGVNANGLPYVSFAFTDAGGNSIDWPFVFGNVPPFSVTARPLSIILSFLAIDGAVAYKVTIQKTGGSVLTVANGFTNLSFSVNNLIPETEYTVRLFSTTDNSIYTQQYEETVTTLANIGSNYTPSDFQNEDGAFDISRSNTDTTNLLSTVLNDIFTTGDKLIVSLPNRAPKTSIFVNQGDSYPILDEPTLIIPFNPDSGPSQTVSMVLSDSTFVPVVYDEVTETITIGATIYSSGDTEIIDGKKMTVVNI